jgi:hypothetical protein
MREMDAKRLARFRDRYIDADDADDPDAMALLCVELIETLDSEYQKVGYRDPVERQRIDALELRVLALERGTPIPSYRPPYSPPYNPVYPMPIYKTEANE